MAHRRSTATSRVRFASAGIQRYDNAIGSTMGYLLGMLKILLGLAPSGDIAQDFWGFRALVSRTDPYPILGDVFPLMGINWPITHASTHPPTAYLLTAPLAFLPWPMASALWGWFMVATILFALRAYGLEWKKILLLAPLVLLWPPAGYSLLQLTPLWLLGIAMAYRSRESNPIAAGAWIGFASLTKFFPALMLIPFLLKRKWSVLVGFGAVWVVSLSTIFLLSPNAIPRYFEVNSSNSIATILRVDNISLLATAYRTAGIIGVVIIAAFLALVCYWGRKDLWRLFNFLSVALLPIAWVYSLLLMLPDWLIIQFNRKFVLLLLAFLVSFVIGKGVLAPYVALVFFLLYGSSFAVIPVSADSSHP